MPAVSILDAGPLEVPKKRVLRDFVVKLFHKRGRRQDPSAAHLLASKSDEEIEPIIINQDKEEQGEYIASGSDGPSDAAISRDSSFTISALRNGKSEKNSEELPFVIPTHGRRHADAHKLGKASYNLIASTLPNKSQQAEVIAIDRELQRMFKLQLGPLTLVSDIAPILRLWSRLLSARGLHGRKVVANTWLDLARATAIVAKKMKLSQITTVLEVQCKLVYPCPRGLRLPADMLTALADRANTGGALRRASDSELLRFCDCIGRLMDDVTSLKNSPTAAMISTEHWLRALNRAANVMPLIEAALKEVARRGKVLSEEIDAQIFDAPQQTTVRKVLVLADVLAELAGTRLAGLSRCLDAATMSAAAAVEHVQAAAKAQPWWKKMTRRPGKLKKQIQGVTFCFDKLLPSHTALGAQEAARYAAEAADSLAQFMVPSVLPALNAEEITRLSMALLIATEEDEGSPAHEPFRQALGLIVAEAVERTERVKREDESLLTRNCARVVVGACRRRLLHVRFTLTEPADGLAISLSKLESWRGRMRRAPIKTHPLEFGTDEDEEAGLEQEEPQQNEEQEQDGEEEGAEGQERGQEDEQDAGAVEPAESEGNEAVSLELHESLIVLEEGEEEVCSGPSAQAHQPEEAEKETEEKVPQQGLSNYIEM